MLVLLSSLLLPLLLGGCPSPSPDNPAYTVSYSGNGATGGVVPTDAATYHTGDIVTVLGNTGTLAKTHASFSDWNTLSDGHGVDRTAGSTFAMGDSNVTLHAKWTDYRHTITIDGGNDFTQEEELSSSTMGYKGYVTWDSNYLYLGFSGPDISSASITRWWLIYIGGSAGTTAGMTYTTQGPTLPFNARWHVRWRMDNGYTNAREYNGSVWTDVGSALIDLIARTGTFIEMRIPMSSVGNPASIQLHMCLINEAASSEWSYASVPSTSFVDSLDPNYTSYFEFTPASGLAPNAYSWLP